MYIKRGKRINLFLVIYFAFLVAVQVLLIIVLRYTPNADAGEIYKAAIELGRCQPIGNRAYFVRFPNNLGLTVVMSFIFRVVRFAAFGAADIDHYLVYAMTMLTAVDAGIFALYALTERTLGRRYAVGALIALLLYLPTYLFPAELYTNSATMFAPITALYLLRLLCETYGGKGKSALRRRAGISAALGFVVALATIIRPTAFIIYIAMWIYCALRKPARVVCKWLAFALLPMLIGGGGCMNMFTYKSYFTAEEVERYASPVLLWAAIGLNEPDDWFKSNLVDQAEWYVSGNEEYFTMETYAKRETYLADQIKIRLSDMGAAGYARFAMKKTAVLYLKRPDLAPGATIVFQDNGGLNSAVAALYSWNLAHEAVNGLVYYGALLLSAFSLLSKRRDCVALLGLFGLSLYLLLFEMKPNYIQNYFFVIIYLACAGFEWLEARRGCPPTSSVGRTHPF